MKCANCQNDIPVDALFCPKCGTETPHSEGPQSIGNQPTLGRDAEPLSVGDVPTVRSHTWKTGQKVMGRYQVIGELGRGGMGVVYKCLDNVGGIEVALKALPPELSHNSGEMEEVRENFQIVEKLHHPNIAAVKTLERDPQSGDYFLILELVEGIDVRKWRKQKGGKVSFDKALPVLRQIAQALDYAHSKRVIHRDIKPGNVMVASDGTVKVLDFGLAAQIQSSLSRVSQVHFSTSGTGPYMAPEQWKGQRQDGATDQYALAVMVYEIASGHVPFDVQDPVALRESVIRDNPTKPDEVGDKIWRVLVRGLGKTGAERFQTCAEFASALQHEAENSRGAGAHTIEKANFRGKFLVLMAALLFMTALGLWLVALGHTDKPANAPLAWARADAELARLADEKSKAEAELKRMTPEKARSENESKQLAEANAKAQAVVKSLADEQAKAQEARNQMDRLASARGSLIINTTPQGATVAVGADHVEKTPATFKGLKTGKVALNISLENYELVRREVEIKENELVDLGTVELIRQNGSVRIKSEPGGAIVTSQGKELGKTPLELHSVPAGETNFTLVLDGYREYVVSGTVKLTNTLSLTARLEQLLYPTGKVKWTNALGMVFAPVPASKVMFCIWETRVQDFEEFSKSADYNADSGMYSLRNDGWKQRGDTWRKPGFPQGLAHPVCGVSWDDAKAFCKWLTEVDRKAGRLTSEQEYRLPSDVEWSAAVGLSNEQGSTPKQKDLGIVDVYPWGKVWPPLSGAGNYAGEESRNQDAPANWSCQAGYNDGYARTSPVGAFTANQLGIYDMGGNLWEWCEDLFDGRTQSRVLRGASWNYHDAVYLASARRVDMMPALRFDYVGFRCVLVSK